MADSQKEYLFVYGTLKKGEKSHFFLKNAQFLGRARLSGFNLYNLGEYPGIKRGSGVVIGEVYALDKELLKIIDEYEEEGKEYKRTCVEVEMENGRNLKVWIYEYLGYVEKKQLIKSGEWMGSFKKEKKG